MTAPTEEVRVVQIPQLLMTVEEAAKALSMGTRSIYDLMYAGEIEGVHAGAGRRSRRITYRSVQAYYERLIAEASAS